MDAGKKVSGLVQTGGAVIGGQVAATVLTNLGLNMLGATAAPGTMVRKAGVVVAPIALGAVIMGLSKNERVQEAGIGCLAAGVASGVNMLMPSAAFFPVADGYGYQDAVFYDEPAQLAAGQQLDMIGMGSGYGGTYADEFEVVEIDQLA